METVKVKIGRGRIMAGILSAMVLFCFYCVWALEQSDCDFDMYMLYLIISLYLKIKPGECKITEYAVKHVYISGGHYVKNYIRKL